MGDKEAGRAPPELPTQSSHKNRFTTFMKKMTIKPDGRQEGQEQKHPPGAGVQPAGVAQATVPTGHPLAAQQPKQTAQYYPQQPTAYHVASQPAMAGAVQPQPVMVPAQPRVGGQPMFVPQYVTQPTVGPQSYMFVAPQTGNQPMFLPQANARPMLGYEYVVQPTMGYQGISQPRLGPRFISQPTMGYQGISQPRLGPRFISQPTMGYQVISQPGMIHQFSAQPMMVPQFNSQPMMGPQVNSQLMMGPQVKPHAGMGPQVNSQPMMGPQVKLQAGMGPQVNSQPIMGPQVNSQPMMGSQVNSQPMAPGFSRPKMPLPTQKPTLAEKLAQAITPDKGHKGTMGPADKPKYPHVTTPRRAAQPNVYCNKFEESNVYEEITFKDGPGNKTYETDTSVYEQPDGQSKVSLYEGGDTYLEITK